MDKPLTPRFDLNLTVEQGEIQSGRVLKLRYEQLVMLCQALQEMGMHANRVLRTIDSDYLPPCPEGYDLACLAWTGESKSGESWYLFVFVPSQEE